MEIRNAEIVFVLRTCSAAAHTPALARYIQRRGNLFVHKLWVNQFGALDAANHIKTLIPQCKGGRWASVEGVEQRIDDAGEAKLGQLLKATLLQGKAGA